jgi:hypothetical protein
LSDEKTETQPMDARRRKFLEDFASLFPRFKSRWNGEQLHRLWFPMVDMMTMDQLLDVLDHFAFHWPDMTQPPGPGDFRRVAKLKRNQGRNFEQSRNVRKMPISAETLARIEDMRKALGKPPLNDIERQHFLKGTYRDEGGQSA